MIKVHHAGKMGDLIYALPVLRALARLKQDKVRLMTSGMVVPMVPLLWEQPYIDDVDVDEAPYEIDNCVFPGSVRWTTRAMPMYPSELPRSAAATTLAGRRRGGEPPPDPPSRR